MKLPTEGIEPEQILEFFAQRSCALHYALNEDHVDSIVGAVRDWRSDCECAR
jgi:hypothetical protein